MDMCSLQNTNLQGLAVINESINHISEIVRPILESIHKLQEIVYPIIMAVKQYDRQIKELGNTLANVFRPIYAINKLGEVQLVYWGYMSPIFVDEVISSTNLNKMLRVYLVQDKFKIVDNTVSKCRSNPIMKRHLRLYDQSVDAFQNGQSDLAVTGLTSVFDGLLADVSQNPTHKLAPRISSIKEKLERYEILDNSEFAVLTLGVTLERTLKSFSAPVSFEQKEPKGLNRHWIAHGRSHRKKTKLDCVKMINLIYGIVLIEELGSNFRLEIGC